MTDNQGAPSADQIPELLSSLMTNKELMEKISAIVGSSSEENDSEKTSAPAASLDGVLSDPTIMAKLPEVISVLRPMLGAPSHKEPPKHQSAHANDRRMALLCALKPYLSPKRCEAIDYMTRISKLGDIMKNLKI